LPAKHRRNVGQARDVATGPRQAVNQPRCNRITHARKNDGNCSGSLLGSQGGRRRGRDEHVNFETYQLISQSGKPVELAISVSILESYVLALNIAEFTERSPEQLVPAGTGTGC
jgi:hypothetical protein